MGHQIIKQPDGKYAVWSSIVDAFTITDATPEGIADEFCKDETNRIRDRVFGICRNLDAGGKPYHQFTMSWDEAKQLQTEIHGEDSQP